MIAKYVVIGCGLWCGGAMGNTLLNYCGVNSDLIHFVCDRADSKQGKYLPGSRILVCPEDEIKKRKPDYIVIFA
ncbi:MAG: hypothetical protein LBC74_04380 [Planctomycetaceae bacterium]|nr:hypothetical protein [Planctomycetaceae bacterium]